MLCPPVIPSLMDSWLNAHAGYRCFLIHPMLSCQSQDRKKMQPNRIGSRLGSLSHISGCLALSSHLFE